MNPLLVVMTVLVGAIGLLNLVLTLGVIRRLRGHTDILDRVLSGSQDNMAPAGSAAGDFMAVTDDGDMVSKQTLTGQTLIGFFMPDCSACEERLPDFTTVAAAYPGGRAQVLAVVTGGEEAVAPYRAKLRGVARVVVESRGGSLTSAFRVNAFPAFGVVDATGTIVATAPAATDLRDAVTV